MNLVGPLISVIVGCKRINTPRYNESEVIFFIIPYKHADELHVRADELFMHLSCICVRDRNFWRLWGEISRSSAKNIINMLMLEEKAWIL